MSVRVSRLSESSSQSESEDPIPTPPPPKPVVVPVPKAKSSKSVDAKPLDVLIAKADQLDKKYNKRFTTDDPGYNETVTSEALPPPCLPEYQGRSFRGGGGGGDRGGGGGGRQYR